MLGPIAIGVACRALVIGAVLLGTIQQLATVTISSALNLLIVGVLLIVFVVIAPNGIVGLVQSRRRARLR